MNSFSDNKSSLKTSPLKLGWHPHLLEKIEMALDPIFNENKYADKILEKIFKANRKLGSRDRKFIAESVYEIVRNYRYFTEVTKSTDPSKLLAAYLIKNNHPISSIKNYFSFPTDQIEVQLTKKFPDPIHLSYPDWIFELGVKQFKERWIDVAQTMNQMADVYLRVNTLKIDPSNLIKSLEKESIFVEKVPKVESALKLTERKNVFTSEAFKNGLFEVQDAGSQLIAPMLQVEPGLRVVDACAGAGGKSLHLASLMKNKGKIIAMDIHEWKLQELKKRAARNKVDIIETKWIESSKVIKRLESSFDRVLLDVPCSGLGVLKRNPDSKWKLTIDEVDRLILLQQSLLQDYSKMLKLNGIMVYATCSWYSEENEIQIQKFLQSEIGKKFKVVKEMMLSPDIDGFDGFYACSLQKVH